MCWTEWNDDFYWWPCRRGDTQGCFCLHFMFRCGCGGSYWLYVKVCLCFFFLLVYFQSPAPLSLIDIVQTLHFKGGTVKSSLRRKVFFSFLLSVQFSSGPKGCTGWQVESPGMASVLLTNESYQKVNKQQRLYEK